MFHFRDEIIFESLEFEFEFLVPSFPRSLVPSFPRSLVPCDPCDERHRQTAEAAFEFPLSRSLLNNSFRRGDSIAEATNTEKVASVDYVARVIAHMSLREAELDSRRFRWQTF